jgi:hypothetical protein
MARDSELVHCCRSVIDAARQEYGDRMVTEPGWGGNPRLLYTETHYALAALLLFLCDKSDDSLLDLAESRLRLWNQGEVPLTFFNSMAVCLAAIVFKRSGHGHAGLRSILEELLANTPRKHRDVAYDQYCGNNAYLQQVAVDTVLLPIACGEAVTREGLDCLTAEFRKFRTEEGFFCDLPRDGTAQEPLHPPTYIMKMLFLAGVCHKLHPGEEFAELFRIGITSVLPLLARDGSFSYFGRTDNSPFAAGLTIFDLRSAAQLCSDRRREFQEACSFAERYYRTFPKTPSGMLQCNRFYDTKSASELVFSRDDYAYVGQYSLASCAYALLGCYWFPVSADPVATSSGDRAPASPITRSKDLGVVKMTGPNDELFLRTGSQVTGWDRRYLGPTILRYQIDDRLLVGAIPQTISTDEKAVQRPRPRARLRRAAELLQRRFLRGIEQLDGTSVGFLPVIRQGPVDYLPYTLLSMEVSSGWLRSRYQMLRLSARGFHPCFIEFNEYLHRKVPGLRPKHYSRPGMRLVDSFELSREIHLERDGCRIEDCISGDLTGKTLLFSVRYFPCASVRLQGLSKRQSMTCWGSDGRQTLELYEAEAIGSRVRYECHIELGSAPSSFAL